MTATDYKTLNILLYRLKEQYENFLNLDKKNLSELDREAVKESVIQRFKFCYDSLWKSLKKYLQQEEGVTELPNSPKPVFRKAYEAKLMDEEDLKEFFSYVDLRIGISDDDNLSAEKEALEKMGDFIQDTSYIYNMLIESK